MAENMTMRQIDYIMEGVRYLNEVGGDEDESDISDDALDSQFSDIMVAGHASGKPYNFKSIRAERTTAT